MTVDQLIAQLEGIRSGGNGKLLVCVNAEELWDSCSRSWNIIDINTVSRQVIEVCDDDGAQVYGRDGLGKVKYCIVLSN